MAKKRDSSSTAVVIGAGPAGLGTALGLKRKGIDVLVLERQEEIGLCRRGETIRYSQEMEGLLYPGFFNKHTVHRINKRRYYSHSEKMYVDRTISTENLIINWTYFMSDIADVVRREGVEIRTGVEVISLIEDHGLIKGLKAQRPGTKKEESIFADTVFSCGGIDDPGSCHIDLDRRFTDFPIYKRLIRGFRGPQDRLEYYLHVDKESIPGIGCIFPRGKGEAEIILLLLTNTMKSFKLPVPFLQVEEFPEYHPTFRDRLNGTETYYTNNTLIPMGGVLSTFAPVPGLVMVGDALGHVDVRGGSGIRTSFLLGYSAGRLSASVIKSGDWSPDKIKLFETHMMENPQMRLLKRHALIYGTARRLLFQRLNDPNKMDKWWFFLKSLMR
ncbi:MAG: NAD(P)/FAD-dependent oxidoreductase [Deltaproteobacteria bacterium]|nr:NAD(P)/FAD-dependent oxidoreductase [Deltaproteobacteria bacterium]